MGYILSHFCHSSRYFDLHLWFSHTSPEVSNPLNSVFFVLGIVIPLLDFAIVAFFPSEQEVRIDLAQNQATNVFIIIRWLYFSLMLFGVLISILPMLQLAGTQQIPQRVDSRAQKELFENLEKMKKEDEDKKKAETFKNALPSDRNLNLNGINPNNNNLRMNPNTVSELLNNQQTVFNPNQNPSDQNNNIEEAKKIDNPDAPKKQRPKLRRKGDPKDN
jgi:hypothetical protein